MSPNRPVALTVVPEGIPEETKRERRWSTWRYRWDGHRWTKKPVGKSNDPSTWTSFDRAHETYGHGGSDGVAFVIGDGWGGADFDKCRTPQTGETEDVAQAHIAALETYTEISPSGTGWKAFFKADGIGFEINYAKALAFTVWTSPRFFCVTGRGNRLPVQTRNAILGEMIEHFEGPKASLPVGEPKGYAGADEMSDEDLFYFAVGSNNGDRFLNLFQGRKEVDASGKERWRPDLDAYGGDHSRADLALLALLAFWTNRNWERMERMFRASVLMRPKLELASYRAATIGKALGLR